MRIGILGAGDMAGALGGQWVRAGHEVMIGARDGAKARALAGRVGARTGTFAETAEFAEAIVTALPWAAVLDVLGDLGAARLRDRVIIDCTCPFDPETYALATAGGPAMPERIAALAPDAGVVKAFNVCAAEVYAMTPPAFDGAPLSIPLCGHPRAVAAAATLAADLGAVPVRAGGMERAPLLDALSVFTVALWFEGADAAAILPPLKYVFGAGA